MSAQIHPVSKVAARILNFITRDLVNPCSSDGESYRKIDNAGAGYMPVSVERIGEKTFAVAHYFVQQGDMCPDPAMTFLRNDQGDWYALSIQQMIDGGAEHYGIELDADEKPITVYSRRARDIREFTTMWLKNIKAQQRLEIPPQPRKTRSERSEEAIGVFLGREERKMLDQMDAFSKANGRKPATESELAAWVAR